MPIFDVADSRHCCSAFGSGRPSQGGSERVLHELDMTDYGTASSGSAKGQGTPFEIRA